MGAARFLGNEEEGEKEEDKERRHRELLSVPTRCSMHASLSEAGWEGGGGLGLKSH